MSCKSCKGSNPVQANQPSSFNARKKTINLALKLFVFLIMLLLMPLFVIGLIIILFNSIVLSRNIDIIPAFRQLITTIGKKNDDEDDEEDDDNDLGVENYELMDVEKIKN